MTPATATPARSHKEKAEKVKKEKKAKTPYTSLPEVQRAKDGNGRLTSMPVPFVPKEHKAPKRTDFANESTFMNFRADVLTARGNAILDNAKRLREEAVQVEKTGDPTKRALLKKAAKMRDSLAALEAQLKAEGIEI